jgi:translocation and assembly module TamB
MKKWRILGWALSVLGILILAGIVGGYLFLESASFQRYAIRTIVEDTNNATGGRAEIGSFDFHPSTLTAHLYDITIRGSEPASQSPLLHIDKLTIGLKIQSLLQRKVTLSQLLIEHPAIQVRVDRQGRSNIPQSPQPQTGGGETNIFDLAAMHVLLSGGEIIYNDASIPLDADLYGLSAEIHFMPSARTYQGSLSYDNGHFRYANEPPFAHSLSVSFRATPSNLSIESAMLRTGSSTILCSAGLTNYSNPSIEGHYDIRVHSQDFAGLSQPLAPAGDVRLSGTIHYRNANERSLLRNISIEGQIGSDELTALSPDAQLSLRKLQGHYQLLDGAFRAHDIAFNALGGSVTADLDVQHLDKLARFSIHTTLKGISLQTAQQALRRPEFKRAVLLGSVDGTAAASWTGAVSQIHVLADLSVKAPVSQSAQISATALPLDGIVHTVYDAPRSTLAFRQTTLSIPSTTITAEGEISGHSNLQLRLTASDLHRITTLVSDLRPGQPVAMQITGSALLNVTAQGSLQNPLLEGQFQGQNLQVEGSQWSSAKFDFRARPSQLALHDAVLVGAHQGKASFSANIALRNWSYAPSNPVTVNVSVQHLSVADLQRFANLHYPVSGDLSAELSLHGSQLSPVGSGSARIENARAYDEPVQHLATTFHADRASLTSTLDVALPAGSASGTVSYAPATRAYTVQLNIPSLSLQKLQIVQTKNLGLTGTLTASATGSGTVDDPQLTVALGVPQLQLGNNSISQIKGELHVANHRAELAFDSQVAQASIHSSGHINLVDDFYTEAAIDSTGVPLAPLLALYVPSLPQGFQGDAEVHATLKGPLKDKSKIEAHLTIPTLKASYQQLEIGAASPIRADYSNSVVTLQPAEIRGTDTSLRLQGSFPLAGTATPSLTIQGSVDMRVLRILEPEVQSSGTLALDIHASGGTNNPVLGGQIHLQDVAFSTAAAPLGVQKLNGTLDLGNSALQLSNLTGEVGGGQLSLGGSVSYRPDVRFDISLQAKSVRVRYPGGLRTVLDGTLALSGNREASTLNGRVLIDTLSFTPDFDLAKFGDQFGGSIAPAEPGLADTIQLAVGVQSKGNLSATSSQLNLAGQVNLQVTGTAANPVVVGRSDLTSGELFYRNVRYQLQRGIITFNNPNQTEPVMDVSATATVEQYNLTLTLRGPFDKLTTTYTSDPPLATADVINLIAQGKTTQEQNAASQSTDSMIASQVASQVTGGIQNLAGISSLQIDPLLGGNNQNPSARVAIQQRVTKNFLFTFSTDLSQPGSEIVQGDYQLNKRWSVSLTRDEVGGISVDGKYHTKF